jgi:hypothetical protein
MTSAKLKAKAKQAAAAPISMQLSLHQRCNDPQGRDWPQTVGVAGSFCALSSGLNSCSLLHSTTRNKQ